MGKCYRNLSNRTCWLRHRAEMQELYQEQGVSLVPKGKIPDPWDDYPRTDTDHSWKKYRKTQYRVKTPHSKVQHPKVQFDSDWCYCCRNFSNERYQPQSSFFNLVWHSYKFYCKHYHGERTVGAILKRLQVGQIKQYRVRSSYRKI